MLLTTCRFSPDGQQLALACGDGSIELRNPDPASKDPIKFLVGGTGEQVPVTAMKYPTNETLTAAGTNGFISFWACKTGKLIDFFREEQNEIYALDYSHERSMFATGGNDKAVRVYDAATNQQMHMYNEKRGEGDIDHVYCLKFHGERRDILVGAGWTRQVRVWDVRVPGVVREIYGPKICGEGLDIDGDTILTSSWLRDDAVQMWDLRFANREPEVLPTPTPNGAYFYCGMFVPHHDLIGCGGSGTHDARLYNRKTHELVGTIECTHPKTKKPKPVQVKDTHLDCTDLTPGHGLLGRWQAHGDGRIHSNGEGCSA